MSETKVSIRATLDKSTGALRLMKDEGQELYHGQIDWKLRIESEEVLIAAKLTEPIVYWESERVDKTETFKEGLAVEELDMSLGANVNLQIVNGVLYGVLMVPGESPKAMAIDLDERGPRTSAELFHLMMASLRTTIAEFVPHFERLNQANFAKEVGVKMQPKVESDPEPGSRTQ